MIGKTGSIILFALCLIVGLRLAAHNPLENDEIYSQLHSIEGLSYGQILAGQVPEGNNCPLFYSLQKTFLNALRFTLPGPWEPEQNICDDRAQIVMRILPIVCMAGAMALMWNFFARRSIIAAILAVLLGLTSPLIWTYWAQARPYSLWMLLTTAQLIFLLDNQPRRLLVVHWLLCLTTSFGLVQAVLAAVLMRKRRFWPLVAPAAAGLFYLLHAPHYPFRVPVTAPLIFENFSLIRLLVLAGCAVLLWRLNAYRTGAAACTGLLGLTVVLLLLSSLIIGYYVHQHVPGTLGFELSSRYFMFLTPVGIFALLCTWHTAWQNTDNVWLKINLAQLLAGVLILDGMRAFVVAQRLWT